MQCDELKRYLSPYLDNELESHLNLRIEEHLEKCSSCRQLYEAEHQWEKSLKAQFISDEQTQQKWGRALNSFNQKLAGRRRLIPAAVCGLVLFLVVAANSFIQFQSYDLSRAALSNHNKYVADQLPLKVFSGSPKIIEKYFQGKLPYAVSIPSIYTLKSVELVGASRCHLNETPVAFLAYSIDQEPVSVFMMDEQQAKNFSQTHEIPGQGSVQEKSYRSKNIVTSPFKAGIVVAVAKLPKETLQQFIGSFR